MSVVSPERIWWKPLSKLERRWVTLAALWCLIMFVMMPAWFFVGQQNVSGESYRIAPTQYAEVANAFIAKYKVGTESGFPIVHPPAGDVYLIARQWQWTPILELEKGKTYRIHVSSLDVQHGFSLQPQDINFQVLPGYDYVLTITPQDAGVYHIICNEYCGIGHHTMVGKLVVR